MEMLNFQDIIDKMLFNFDQMTLLSLQEMLISFENLSSDENSNYIYHITTISLFVKDLIKDNKNLTYSKRMQLQYLFNDAKPKIFKQCNNIEVKRVVINDIAENL